MSGFLEMPRNVIAALSPVGVEAETEATAPARPCLPLPPCIVSMLVFGAGLASVAFPVVMDEVFVQEICLVA
jgi:hypothetical protein